MTTYYDDPKWWDSLAHEVAQRDMGVVMRISDRVLEDTTEPAPEYFLDTPVEGDWYVKDQHPSNIASGFFLYGHLGQYVDENTPVDFALVEIVDLNDPEALVGWAILYREVGQ